MGGGFSAFTAFVACVGKREISQLPFLIFLNAGVWVYRRGGVNLVACLGTFGAGEK